MIVSLPSRNQLLAWVSHLTNITVLKLQELSDGVHFCQIFDKIYPKIINLHKLKRDAKVPLEKERNFKLLLNAINRLGLPVTINIFDLSNGKIAPTLEFLQWFYKQYKSPLQKNPPFEQEDERLNEPRVKSYVGNIYVSQKSCYKANDQNPNLGLSRRSLDSKLLQKKVFQPQKSKSLKSKSTRRSQPKENIQSTGKTSKIKSVTTNKDVFEQVCRDKKQSTQQMKSKMKYEFKEETFQQILERTLNSEKPRLQKALIKVTESVLENNPELEAKIKMLLQSGEDKRVQTDNLHLSPDSQVRNILNSYRNTSEQCESDALEHVELEKIDCPIEGFNVNTYSNVQPFQMSAQSTYLASEKKQNERDKKETVKKSMMKSDKEKGFGDILMSQKSIKQLSAQKQRNRMDCHDLPPQSDQNKQENQVIISKFHLSNVFNPHQKAINPETYVTEKKIEAPKGSENDEVRQVQSEKISVREDNDSWKQNQIFGSYPNLPL